MITRRDAAQRLDIPVEMAARHGLPARLTEEQLGELEQSPPAWLVQSRANRTGKRAVWVEVTCYVCGFSETARPKKWWPTFTYVMCDHHSPADLPEPGPDQLRADYPGVASRFIGVVDTTLD